MPNAYFRNAITCGVEFSSFSVNYQLCAMHVFLWAGYCRQSSKRMQRGWRECSLHCFTLHRCTLARNRARPALSHRVTFRGGCTGCIIQVQLQLQHK